MKLSIIVETYNHEKYIEECLQGIFNQKINFDCELILANDCSTDKTHQVIEKFLAENPTKIKVNYFNHLENKGMNMNFIFTLEQCKGEYIAFCEGDDYWIDDYKLQKQVDFLDSNQEYSLCFHKTNQLNLDGGIVKSSNTFSNDEDKTFTLKDIAKGNFIHTPSVVFRNIIKKYPFEFKETPFGDVFLYIMLAEQGNLKYLKDNMAVYRYGVGVFSGNSTLNKAKSNLKSLTCLLSYCKDEEIKKIIFDKQLLATAKFENQLMNQYKDVFVSNNGFLKTIRKIKNNYKQPLKIIKKIKSKF